MVYFNFIYFYINLVYSKASYSEPWGPALWTTVLVFDFVYPKILNIFGISYWYKYRATYILLKQTQLALEKYTLQILLSWVQATEYDKLPLQVIPCTICSSTIFKLFYVDAINWKFWFIFVSFIRLVVNF